MHAGSTDERRGRRRGPRPQLAAAGRRSSPPRLLLLLAGRGRLQPRPRPPPLGAEPDDDASPVAARHRRATPAAPITGLTADDFDPQGDPPEENPDLAAARRRRRPGTAWRTMTYTQNLGPGGLKTGVGLIVDLGADHDVCERRPHPRRCARPPSRIYVTAERPDRASAA